MKPAPLLATGKLRNPFNMERVQGSEGLDTGVLTENMKFVTAEIAAVQEEKHVETENGGNVCRPRYPQRDRTKKLTLTVHRDRWPEFALDVERHVDWEKVAKNKLLKGINVNLVGYDFVKHQDGCKRISREVECELIMNSEGKVWLEPTGSFI